MLGGLGNFAGMLKSAKELQGNLARMQEEMASRRFEAASGGGLVQATVDGRSTLLAIKIDPKAATDVELLEDLIVAAVGAAVVKAQEAMKNDLASLTGGLNIPGLSQMLGGA